MTWRARIEQGSLAGREKREDDGSQQEYLSRAGFMEAVKR